MKITHNEVNGITFLAIKGRLDAESAPEAKNFFEDILENDQPKLLFDFSMLDYISSAGLRVILNAVKRVMGMRGKFVICNLNEIVKEVFDNNNFPLAGSVESGIKTLNKLDRFDSSRFQNGSSFTSNTPKRHHSMWPNTASG